MRNINKRIVLLSIFLLTIFITSFSQNTIVSGIVRDSITNEALLSVTIRFDNTSVGTFSDTNGKYRLVTGQKHTKVTASLIGYKSKTFTIQPGITTSKNILLVPEDLALSEVIIKPDKEKYSKKNNPAVELIKKVIAHKHENNIKSHNSYQNKEYEKMIVALNEFHADRGQFKKYKFLPKYVDSSFIDKKLILPFSVRERIAENYYQQKPSINKKVVKAYQVQGLDQAFDTEGLDSFIKEVFKDVSIYDNSIILLFNSFISPLSEQSAVNFYKWYIQDTVVVDQKKYVELAFAPFNSRDIGFTGHLYISTDSSYAVKRAMIRVPKKSNLNFVDNLIIQQDFTQNNAGKWVPDEFRMAVDMSMLDAVKIYVDKTLSYSDFKFDEPINTEKTSAPIVYEDDYLYQPKEFWIENRPLHHQKDMQMEAMMKDIKDIPFIKLFVGLGKIFSSGYISTAKSIEESKVDIGTAATFFSYNRTEGARFRLTAATTKKLHPHLYGYGYLAYGLKDNKFKYNAELSWAFNKVLKHPDEFPINKLTLQHTYDISNLGQRFTQAERDNIFMSLSSSRRDRQVYSRQTNLIYHREYHGGFSFKALARTLDDRPAGNLILEKILPDNTKEEVKRIKTTELSLTLRYAHNEILYQQRRKRMKMPSPKFVTELSHSMGLKDVLGGEYRFNKTTLYLGKEFWITPYGKIRVSGEAGKLWGTVPFPLLITPSANTSYTIQSGGFYLLEPLEFVHDSQVSWEIYYHMGGWLFNRIPVLKLFKFREVFGFRGFYGDLSDRNNPQKNRDLIQLPGNTYQTKNKPYMEYNIGIENILKFFRVDYVHRINYLNHPDIDKSGFRVSFEASF